MEEGDVKPGQFLEFTSRTIDEPALVYVVKDAPKERAWVIVDLYIGHAGMRYMSYFAVTKDVEEFNGNIDKAKKETIKAAFIQ